MDAKYEAEFERKAESMLNGHRQAPNGRNFLAFTMRYQNNQGYKERFDGTFGGSPGSEEWFAGKYCQGCGKNREWCECEI